MHDIVAPHAIAHAPQLLASDNTSVHTSPHAPRPPRHAGATTAKLHGHPPYALLVIPLRMLPAYEDCPARISMVMVPPAASVMRPA
jgi:hypothetical protein